LPHALYDLPKDFAGKVRLFPLPDLVVFPRTIQGLHIFEPRYCAMLEDALEHDRLITMATLMPGSTTDFHGHAAISPLVCIGRVTAHERNADGTHDLALLGLRRARIRQELPLVRAYREAAVEIIQDCDGATATPDASCVAAELAACLRRRVAGAEKLVDEFTQGEVSLGLVTDIVAFHLPLETSVKLDLLGEADVLQRARILLDTLSRPARESNGCATFPPEFSSN
jgi:ATP-dependent Lon protease